MECTQKSRKTIKKKLDTLRLKIPIIFNFVSFTNEKDQIQNNTTLKAYVNINYRLY